MDTIKYEELPGHIKENLSRGHILAQHALTNPNGFRTEHLTTVQVIGEDIESGAPAYYCNDICGTDCDLGSVQLVMAEMPKFPFVPLSQLDWAKKAFTAVQPTPEGGAFFEEALALVGGLSPLTDMSFLMGTVDALADAVAEIHPRAEAAFAAQGRMEELREWTYERYRIATHNGDPSLMRLHAVTLFFVVTGLKPGDDHELFGMFVEHLSDSVLLFDAEKMPEFQPEVEPDCGG